MLFPLRSGCRTSRLCLKCQQHTALQICLTTGKSVVLSVLLLPPTHTLPLGGSLLWGLGVHVHRQQSLCSSGSSHSSKAEHADADHALQKTTV